MDTLIEIEQLPKESTLTLPQASLLSAFITATTLLGVAYGKQMEKTVAHFEVPVIHHAARHSRRLDE